MGVVLINTLCVMFSNVIFNFFKKQYYYNTTLRNQGILLNVEKMITKCTDGSRFSSYICY